MWASVIEQHLRNSEETTQLDLSHNITIKVYTFAYIKLHKKEYLNHIESHSMTSNM